MSRLTAAAETGIDAEIVDLRTCCPSTSRRSSTSVEKTGRCLIVHEATRTGGYGAELSALVQERCFYHLEAPILRVTGWDTPYPHEFRVGLLPRPAPGRRSHAADDGRMRSEAMATYVFKLPDVGEGVAEAEIIQWHVKVGDRVKEDQPLVDVMTDKATVEISSPVAGTVRFTRRRAWNEGGGRR